MPYLIFNCNGVLLLLLISPCFKTNSNMANMATIFIAATRMNLALAPETKRHMSSQMLSHCTTQINEDDHTTQIKQR